MLAFPILTAVTFSLFGFIIGIWADGFEKLQLVPLLIVTPLAFLTTRLANDNASQSRRLSGQRVSLELLREFRCERWRKPQHDHGLPDPLPGYSVVDLQDRIPAQNLKRLIALAALARIGRTFSVNSSRICAPLALQPYARSGL
jgi:hypothetical protein